MANDESVIEGDKSKDEGKKTEPEAHQSRGDPDEGRKNYTGVLSDEIVRRCGEKFRIAVGGILADMGSKEPMARGRSRFENILTNLLVGVFLVVLGWWLGK